MRIASYIYQTLDVIFLVAWVSVMSYLILTSDVDVSWVIDLISLSVVILLGGLFILHFKACGTMRED